MEVLSTNDLKAHGHRTREHRTQDNHASNLIPELTLSAVL